MRSQRVACSCSSPIDNVTVSAHAAELAAVESSCGASKKDFKRASAEVTALGSMGLDKWVLAVHQAEVDAKLGLQPLKAPKMPLLSSSHLVSIASPRNAHILNILADTCTAALSSLTAWCEIKCSVHNGKL